MAKTNFAIRSIVLNDIMATQMFNSVNTTNQVGDRFFVPTENALLILGNALEMTDRFGNIVRDENGNPRVRQAGQHFCTVRIVDGVPTEVVELYVGQVVKVDVNRKFVFPGELSNALRQGDAAFKNAICNKILEITDEQMCQDRIFDPENQRYMRDENNKFLSQEKTALKFESKKHNMNPKVVEKCVNMLLDYYRENYKEFISE